MTDKIWVFAEHEDGEFKQVVFELLAEAAKLRAVIGGEVEAIVLAGKETTLPLSLLNEHGAKTVLLGRHSIFEDYDAEARVTVLDDAVRRYEPRLVLIGATPVGNLLSRSLAARLGASFVPDYTRIETRGDSLMVTRLVYGGKLGASVIALQPPLIALLKPGMVRVDKPVATDTGKIVELEVGELSEKSGKKRVEVIQHLPADPASVDLSEADIVIGAGKGVCTDESFPLLQEMARELKARVGGTRRATDKGWLPSEDMIGQTGKIISPRLYISVGVSGASKHVAGVKDAELKIAINNDRDAAIFNTSDLGVIGDARQVLPAFVKRIKDIKSDLPD